MPVQKTVSGTGGMWNGGTTSCATPGGTRARTTASISTAYARTCHWLQFFGRRYFRYVTDRSYPIWCNRFVLSKASRILCIYIFAMNNPLHKSPNNPNELSTTNTLSRVMRFEIRAFYSWFVGDRAATTWRPCVFLAVKIRDRSATSVRIHCDIAQSAAISVKFRSFGRALIVSIHYL